MGFSYLCRMDYRDNLLLHLKKQWQKQLKDIYPAAEARQLIQMLIQHELKLSRTQQALHPDYRLSESELLKLHQAIKRLRKEEPLQYITGYADFCGLQLRVNPAVLIPRPETEELVDLILKENRKKDARILDIGTGSGCIALALKKNMPAAKVQAIDISAEALKIANDNAITNHLEVKFNRCDILEETTCLPDIPFDIIVSNPPYVTEKDRMQMQKNVVGFEPHIALFVKDTDPLLFYRHIAQFALMHLEKQGKLYFEINESFGKETLQLLNNLGFEQVKLHNDIHNKARFVEAYRPA